MQWRSHQYGEPWRPPYLAGDEPEPSFLSPGAQSLSCSAKHHGQAWKSVRPSSLRRKKITIRFGPLSSWASVSPSQAHCQIEDEPSYTVTHSYANAGGFFIFIFFISVFYKNIFSIWKITEIYPGRLAAGRPGLICNKKDDKKLQTGPWEPAARQQGGRPPRPPGCGAAGIFFCNLALFAK